MSGQLDRPARPPRRPRPAADAGVDPVDYRAVGAAEVSASTLGVMSPDDARSEAASGGGSERRALAPLSARGPAARDVTVQLNNRIAIDVAAIFDAASAQFPSKRAALEHAIRSTFAPGGEAAGSSG